jgi:hypothetical protein
MDHLDRLSSRPLILATVLLAAFLVLGIGIERSKVAAPISDPVGGYRSQDESLFAASSITMAVEGHWLTPRFLGRIYLYKPPLQLWLSAISMKLLGISLFALRLPMLIAGVCGVLLVFLWSSHTALWSSHAAHSVTAGITAALLLASDPMWNIFSRLCYTDLLLAFFTAAALYCVFHDPRLERRISIAGFGIFTAAAIMTKSIGGAIPILTLLLCALAIRREQRPRAMHVAAASVLAILLAAPWHLYQWIVHRSWFWADYIQTQILAYGINPPAQISSEIPLVFYAKGLFLTDPVLCIFALASIPGLVVAAKRRESVGPVLLLSWLVTTIIALSSFQVRGQFRWVLFLIPPLCLLAANFAPVRRSWLIAILCAALVLKATEPSKTWGLSFGSNPPMPSETWLRAYADRARANPLVLVDADDELYAATLPVPKIDYCWIDPNGLVQRLAPHYVELGITVTAAQFDDIGRVEPGFRRRLSEWGLDSDAPIATAVVAASDADVAAMIAAHPNADFYLPARFRASVEKNSTHDVYAVSDQRFFLMAKQSSQAAAPLFKLPANW